MKETWSILSNVLHRKAVNSLPDTMTVEGHDCGDRKVIIEAFNNFSPLLEIEMDILIQKEIATFVTTLPINRQIFFISSY